MCLFILPAFTGYLFQPTYRGRAHSGWVGPAAWFCAEVVEPFKDASSLHCVHSQLRRAGLCLVRSSISGTDWFIMHCIISSALAFHNFSTLWSIGPRLDPKAYYIMTRAASAHARRLNSNFVNLWCVLSSVARRLAVNNKKLSCRRESAQRFVSLNILLSHSRSLKSFEMTLLSSKSLLVFYWNYACISYFWDIQRERMAWPWNRG